MVKRFWALLAVLAVMGATSGCKRNIDNEDAVRQGVIDYLSKRTNVNVSGMNVAVTSVSFRQNEADAVVAFTARGGNAGPPMTMRYTLERQGDHWSVKDKSETGNPHGANGANPHGAPAAAPMGDMPPGHPPVESTQPKP